MGKQSVKQCISKKLAFFSAALLFFSCDQNPIVITNDDNIIGLASRPDNSSCLAPNSLNETRIITQEVLQDLNFIQPIQIIQIPGDFNSIFILEKQGKVIRVSNFETTPFPDTFLDISGKVLNFSDSGLLGGAFHPQFQDNGKLYLYYSAPVPGVNYSLTEDCSFPTDKCTAKGILEEYTFDVSVNPPQLIQEKPILTVDFHYVHHHGGVVRFGKDGFLYLSLGEGTESSAAQDLSNLLGKVTRIDVDQGDPYSIPADNPFLDGTSRPEIYAYGFRNPWQFSIDSETGDLWLADVGNLAFEEVNHVEKGANYGWPIFEGPICYFGPCDSLALEPPTHYYGRTEGCAIIGGFIYRGQQIPSLYGQYIFSDLCTGAMWGLQVNLDGSYTKREYGFMDPGIVSFAEIGGGELYFVNIYSNKLFKIVGLTEENHENWPPKDLSQTGCFDPTDPKKSLGGLIPYDVNIPLWSDGAEKYRWMALPNETKVGIHKSGNWIFPVGTIFLKRFEIEGKLIETRFLVQHQENEWRGYTYEWNEEQTEATLVDDGGKLKTLFNGQEWLFPGRGQCLRCHTEVAGRVLGPGTLQMNRLFQYPSTGIVANQIDTWEFIEIFEEGAGIPRDKAFPPFESLTSDSDPEEAARGYLHVNCAFCHQPGGPGIGPEDFRFETPLGEMGACDVSPTTTDLGISGAKLLDPGNAENSIIPMRMQDLGAHRMPPLATFKVDEKGLGFIKSWINELHSCNPPPK